MNILRAERDTLDAYLPGLDNVSQRDAAARS